MVCYIDTSALVPLCVKEAKSAMASKNENFMVELPFTLGNVFWVLVIKCVSTTKIDSLSVS